ncbi:copper homeostasis protein CutC [Sphingobacterium wenxiniae]|uniref:PF03932 family protein CutC n=1 Tax=Sphingobacterium wenxiniae TaxID=683125 RepID=A0A1I6VEZ2_9SPHI|nr:copper homeostasis protein CutC [Sphingobacterium wenxiniae]SFT12235.1 copper homeostasis protein [Sphingobacterium wenxiniae]
MGLNEKEINGYKLEICSNSSYSALQAQLGGASRVELCQNLENGGTTPSFGQIKRTRELLSIGIHVLIRPRGGDFVYNEEEFEEMKRDILFCKEVGCDGVVIGVLKPDGSVDKERCKQLQELAEPMTVVFHRAFDRCKDPKQALEDVIELGFDRVLTSGLRNTAVEGKDLLKALVLQASGRIEIMPGAGVNEENIIDLLNHTGAKSIHSSAKITVRSQMRYESDDLQGMNEPTMQTCKDRVAELVEKIQNL